jgi:indole-3-glycerol phosphate synthase
MNILNQIIDDKRAEISERKTACPMAELRAILPQTEPRPDFKDAIRGVPMGLIAEVKRRSPSAGLIREPFDPAAIAISYAENRASAVSCLMDQKYFGGGDADFSAVRNAIDLPMLYKEFVVDSWQIVHAKVMGASAVLLIAGALSDEDLKSFSKEIRSLDLLPLVEVHDQEEMQRAIQAGADCIGINNRNLKTFVTTLDTTYELAAMAPAGSTLISESGIRTPEDVALLRQAGAHAVLVGESLLKASDPGSAAALLMSQV